MKIIRYNLWETVPGSVNYIPYLEHYEPENKSSNSALLILPGSGYHSDPSLPKQEGERVAKYYAEKGINVFLLRYRVFPDIFPLPILDGRRAVRYIRYNSEKFGINKNSIAAMGFSSGGHLTASLFTYNEKIDYEDIDEIDNESFTPDFQILCYPVISLDRENDFTHQGSTFNLPGEKYEELKDVLSFEKSTNVSARPTFIWHNFDDSCVGAVNSLRYAENLKKQCASVEMHIFPDGNHGIGLPMEDTKALNHDRKWIDLLTDWLIYSGFFDK